MADREKFYWSARTSSGGTLSIESSYEGTPSRMQKERLLAEAIDVAHKHMQEQRFIPSEAKLMTSSDIAKEHGNSRQYWEKLLNEGKILYREDGTGRITTDIWVKGYLGKREEVNRYVQHVKNVRQSIKDLDKKHGKVPCPACFIGEFEYYENYSHLNGICRSCGFYVHSTSGE